MHEMALNFNPERFGPWVLCLIIGSDITPLGLLRWYKYNACTRVDTHLDPLQEIVANLEGGWK